jgi:hypothetical protein
MIRIPDPNEPQRFPDGEVEGPNGQSFYFWLGSDDEQEEGVILEGGTNDYQIKDQ